MKVYKLLIYTACLIILVSCNTRHDVVYYIVFTNRYEDINSVVVGYDKDGNKIKEHELQGPRYQNLLQFQNKVLAYNGTIRYEVDINTDQVNTYTNGDGTNKSIERNGANKNEEGYYYIDNRGIENEEYINYIELSNGMSIEVKGFITAHYIVNNSIFLIYQGNELLNGTKHIYKYMKVDIISGEVIDEDDLKGASLLSSIRGGGYSFEENKILFYAENETAPNVISQTLYIYNIDTLQVEAEKIIGEYSVGKDKTSKMIISPDFINIINGEIYIAYSNGIIEKYNTSLNLLKEMKSSFLDSNKFLYIDFKGEEINALKILDDKAYIYKLNLILESEEIIEIDQIEYSKGLIPYDFLSISKSAEEST